MELQLSIKIIYLLLLKYNPVYLYLLLYGLEFYYINKKTDGKISRLRKVMIASKSCVLFFNHCWMNLQLYRLLMPNSFKIKHRKTKKLTLTEREEYIQKNWILINFISFYYSLNKHLKLKVTWPKCGWN